MLLKRIQQELTRLTEAKSLRELHVRTLQKPGKLTIKGKKLVDLSNWDFLNLNHEKKFIHAFQKEAHESGVGAMASRASSGTLAAHASLEKRLAEFLIAESALLLSSGNQVVLSLVSALLGEGDCVVVDERVHSRVLDAAALVNAEVIPFDTANMDSLAKALTMSKPYKGKVVFCEGVNPLTGEVLDIKTVIELTTTHNVPFVLNESYSIGILGLRGAGLLDGQVLPPSLLCRYGSMSYGLGAYGAYIAGSKSLIDYLINRSRTITSEAALPPALAAAVETAINIVELEHGKREHLHRISNRLATTLRGAGIPVSLNVSTPIICINLPSKRIAQELVEGLFHKGYFIEAIAPGFILDSGAAVRVLLNCAHKDKDIDELGVAFIEIYKRIV